MAKLTDLQNAQLAFLQSNLRRIRSICEWSGSDLADVLGLSRQTINNLETDKVKMTPSLYLAIASMLRKYCDNNPIVKKFLNVCFTQFPREIRPSNLGISYAPQWAITSHSYEDDAIDLLESWFSGFPKQFSSTSQENEADSGIKSMQLMEYISLNCKIFVCPDVLIDDKFLSCIEDLCAICKENNNEVLVPAKAFKGYTPSLSQEISKRLENLLDEKSLCCIGSENDPQLHELIVEKFIYFKNKYHLCLITNDENISNDVHQLNSFKTLSGLPIITLEITENSHIKLIFNEDFTFDSLTEDNTSQSREIDSLKETPHTDTPPCSTENISSQNPNETILLETLSGWQNL